jgi:hypothetical protein
VAKLFKNILFYFIIKTFVFCPLLSNQLLDSRIYDFLSNFSRHAAYQFSFGQWRTVVLILLRENKQLTINSSLMGDQIRLFAKSSDGLFLGIMLHLCTVGWVDL